MAPLKNSESHPGRPVGDVPNICALPESEYTFARDLGRYLEADGS